MVDAETRELEEVTLRGGWRLLCVSTLHQCVQRLEEDNNLFNRREMEKYLWRGAPKEGLYQKKGAERWLEGGIGQITFEDACEVMSVSPEVARRKIMEYVRARKRRPLRDLFKV